MKLCRHEMPAFSCCQNPAYCKYNSGSCQLLPADKKGEKMNEYIRYENMRREMAECAEVVRRVLGLTVPVSVEDLIFAMDKIGIQCIPDDNLNTDTEIKVLPEGNPDYAFRVVYNAKIDERNLVFCLASAMGDILLHRLDCAK